MVDWDVEGRSVEYEFIIEKEKGNAYGAPEHCTDPMN